MNFTKDTLTIKGVQYPILTAYSTMMEFQETTGKNLMELQSTGNLTMKDDTTLVYCSIKVGYRHKDEVCPLTLNQFLNLVDDNFEEYMSEYVRIFNTPQEGK